MKKRKLTKKQLEQLDDDNIPVVKNTESVEEYERRTGHGFWGNSTTGYVKDKHLKRYGYEI